MIDERVKPQGRGLRTVLRSVVCVERWSQRKSSLCQRPAPQRVLVTASAVGCIESVQHTEWTVAGASRRLWQHGS